MKFKSPYKIEQIEGDFLLSISQVIEFNHFLTNQINRENEKTRMTKKIVIPGLAEMLMHLLPNTSSPAATFEGVASGFDTCAKDKKSEAAIVYIIIIYNAIGSIVSMQGFSKPLFSTVFLITILIYYYVPKTKKGQRLG